MSEPKDEQATADYRAHWDRVHLEKDLSRVSWVRAEPSDSLHLLRLAGLSRATRLVDLGAGISNLADHLMAVPIAKLLLVDISAESLRLTRRRLQHIDSDTEVSDRVADVGREEIAGDFDILHDRAVLHFLLEDHAKRGWLENAKRLVAPGGKLVVGTFSEDGPTRCSGLDVQRYGPDDLARFLSPIAQPVSVSKVVHTTPGGAPQSFTYGVFARR